MLALHQKPFTLPFTKLRTEGSQENIWTAVSLCACLLFIAQEYRDWWCLFFRDTSGQGRFCTIFRSYSRGAQVRTQMFFTKIFLHSKTKQREKERGFEHCIVVEIHPGIWNAPPRDQQFLFKLYGMWLNRGGSLLLMWHFPCSGPYTHVIILSTMRGNRPS